MSMRLKIWVAGLLAVAALLLVATQWVYDKLQVLQSLDRIEAVIARDFPDVTHLDTATVDALRQSDPALLLVDCRKPEEYAVSHLPGAVNLRSADEVLGYLEREGIRPSRIVSYCSVGWRSSRLTRALLTEGGVADAASLRGSIFRWANEDRPLVKPDGSPAATVHPLHRVWAHLLKEGKAGAIP